jgi:hypothetical protein
MLENIPSNEKEVVNNTNFTSLIAYLLEKINLQDQQLQELKLSKANNQSQNQNNYQPDDQLNHYEERVNNIKYNFRSTYFTQVWERIYSYMEIDTTVGKSEMGKNLAYIFKVIIYSTSGQIRQTNNGLLSRDQFLSKLNEYDNDLSKWIEDLNKYNQTAKERTQKTFRTRQIDPTLLKHLLEIATETEIPNYFTELF